MMRSIATLCDWLPLLNFIVQCGLFVGLVWYTLETRKIRKASQRSADAATDAAKAAQENLRLLKESYEEKTGQGPQIVREAIQRAKGLIAYWKYTRKPRPRSACQFRLVRCFESCSSNFS